MTVQQDEHGNVYGDGHVIDNVFVNGQLVSSRARGGAMSVKVRKVDAGGRPGPERAVAPTPAPPKGGVAQVKGKGMTGPRWRGCIPASVFASALIALIPVAALALVVLSVLGTFYGARGLEVPLLTPPQILADIQERPWVFVLAMVAQGVLSVAQYGCPELAREDRRWWVGYVLALGLSMWFNWIGYEPVLAAIGVPWLVVLGAVLIGDVVPEVAAKRR